MASFLPATENLKFQHLNGRTGLTLPKIFPADQHPLVEMKIHNINKCLLHLFSQRCLQIIQGTFMIKNIKKQFSLVPL